MEAVLERPKTVWVEPTRKMTMDELWARFEYDPDYEEEVLAHDSRIFDQYGNPTYGTLCAWYEDENDIGETMTLEEFHDWLDETIPEAEDERS